MKKTKQMPNAIREVEKMVTSAERQVVPLWAEYQRQVAPMLWRVCRAALGEEGK